MSREEGRGFDWGHLGIGVLFVLAALLSFRDPLGSLVSIVMYFAILAIIKGVFEIFVRSKIKSLTGYKSYAPLVMGIINIIIGIYLLFNLNIGLAILPYVFATWFILDSVFSLLTSDMAKTYGTAYFWFSVIINIFGIVVGVSLLINPISAALTLSFLVGFYFMIFGIGNIVLAFK